MKPYCVVAISLLIFAFCSLGLGQSAHGPNKCCFKYFSGKIPINVVQRYETTSPDCTKQGVIFYTARQQQICVNPAEKWVSRVMKKVDDNMMDSAALGSGESASI